MDGLLSPDEGHFAFIDYTQDTLCIISVADNARDPDTSATVHRFSACSPPNLGGPKGKTDGSSSSKERLASFCWSPDSGKVVAATSSGSIYILERWGGSRD